MGMKEFVFNGESQLANNFYLTMLKSLNHPARAKMGDASRLLKASGLQPGQVVLEIGCGSGYFTEKASHMLGNRGHLFAADIHPASVQGMQQKIEDLGLSNVSVHQDDATQSKFDNDMFDLILLFGVVPAPVISMKDLSKELYRLLKPGSVCAIWTMMPLWSPRAALKHAPFEKMEKNEGVFLLYKTD